MRTLVVGCGSIGSRRARILAETGHYVGGYDLRGIVVDTVPPGVDVSYLGSLAGAIDAHRPDAAFVCTPPDSHVDLAVQAMRAGVRGVFIEKPLAPTADRLDELVEVAGETGAVTMVACNLRFDSRLADLDGVPVQSAVFRMGQHARHWSPGHQPMSMILDSIHEMDLAVSMLGPIGEVMGASNTENAYVELTHLRGTSRVVLDRVTDPPVRTVTVWDGVKERVVNLWPPDPDMYRREMEHFLGCVERGERTCNPVSDAVDTLRWALEV